MNKIKWRKEYSVGIREMDNQHKKIIKVLNQFLKMGSDKKDMRAVKKMLDNLRHYILEHFNYEEKYILHNKPAIYDDQKQAHNKIIDKFCDFEKQYLKTGKLTEINFFNFIWDWFSNHIMKKDMQYSPVKK